MDHGVPYNAAFFHNDKMLETNDDMTITDLVHEHNDTRKSHKNLTIHNSVRDRDEGDYKCTVIDYHNNTNSKIETITFVTDPMVEFVLTSSIITLDKGKKQAAFLIDYKAYPPASFNFFNPEGEHVSCNMDVMNRSKYDVVKDPNKIKFVVKYPTLDDFGNYTLMATTAGQSFNTSMRLVVNGELATSFL